MMVTIFSELSEVTKSCPFVSWVRAAFSLRGRHCKEEQCPTENAAVEQLYAIGDLRYFGFSAQGIRRAQNF